MKQKQKVVFFFFTKSSGSVQDLPLVLRPTKNYTFSLRYLPLWHLCCYQTCALSTCRSRRDARHRRRLPPSSRSLSPTRWSRPKRLTAGGSGRSAVGQNPQLSAAAAILRRQLAAVPRIFVAAAGQRGQESCK